MPGFEDWHWPPIPQANKVWGVASGYINQVGSAVSESLDVYMRWVYRIAWPMVNRLNKHGLHVRRYQMMVILSLAIPAAVSGVLGYALGRISRRR